MVDSSAHNFLSASFVPRLFPGEVGVRVMGTYEGFRVKYSADFNHFVQVAPSRKHEARKKKKKNRKTSGKLWSVQ